MKHTLLSLLALFSLVFTCRAQALFSVSPNPAEEVFNVDLTNLDLDLEVHATVKNLSDDTLRLKWERFEMNRPEGWETQVCDNNFCYLPQVSTNYDEAVGVEEPVVLPPDSSFVLIFHVLPNGMPGQGSFDLDWSLVSDPENVLETTVFRADVQNLTTSVDTRPALVNPRLYPNPADDYFELTDSRNVDQLVIYNVLGRRIRQFQAVGGKRYYLTGLPDGMYLVTLVNQRQGILRTLRLSKRSMRP